MNNNCAKILTNLGKIAEALEVLVRVCDCGNCRQRIYRICQLIFSRCSCSSTDLINKKKQRNNKQAKKKNQKSKIAFKPHEKLSVLDIFVIHYCAHHTGTVKTNASLGKEIAELNIWITFHSCKKQNNIIMH